MLFTQYSYVFWKGSPRLSERYWLRRIEPIFTMSILWYDNKRTLKKVQNVLNHGRVLDARNCEEDNSLMEH